MTAFLWIYLLIGPAIVLAIWIWLRSRREPVSLIEPLEIGRVISGAFGAFGNWRVVALAVVVIGGTRAIDGWVLRSLVPPMVAGLANMQKIGAGALLGVLIGWVGYVVRLFFYIPATYGLIRTQEGVVSPWSGAAHVSFARYLPLFAISTIGFFGGFVGLIAFIVPLFILVLNWAVILPVGVMERRGVLGTFARSRQLALGSRGRMLLVYVLFGVMTMIVIGISGLLRRFGSVSPDVLIGGQIVVAIVTAIAGAGLQSSMYLELRRIREGMLDSGLADVFA